MTQLLFPLLLLICERLVQFAKEVVVAFIYTGLKNL